MKTASTAILSFIVYISAFAQKHTPLPHGMVFGDKPKIVNLVPATNLDNYMGKKARTSGVIVGRVLRVTKPQGGWFEVEGGHGQVIQAHFRDVNVTLPTDLKGREVIMDGVAARQFTADNMQHFAGGKSEDQSGHKNQLTFEVRGLMVNK